MSNAHGLDLPDDPAARAVLADPACVTTPLRRLDLGAEGIACRDLGHRLRRRFRLDRYSGAGCARRTGPPGGITDVPGLYFLGLPWLSKLNSAFLSGVGDDAAVARRSYAARG